MGYLVCDTVKVSYFVVFLFVCFFGWFTKCAPVLHRQYFLCKSMFF